MIIKLGNSSPLSNAKKLKVAHIASGDLWAGAEVQLFTLAMQLQKLSNIELHICLLNDGQLSEKLTNAGITVSIFDESKFGMLSIGAKLYCTLRQFKPDVIHTHRLKENILGSVVALLLANTPSIRTVHGASEHHHGVFKLHKRLQNYSDYLCGKYLQKSIVAVSEDLAEQLDDTYPTSKITTIVNGVDSQAIELLAAERTELSNPKASEVNICFVGRLVPVKRVDVWLQTAAVLVKNRDHKFAFYIIGDGPEKEHLVALAEKLKLADCVHFLGEQQNVAALLNKMDILLLTSDHEGLPMVILEALTTKTLVVAHSVGGISAVLDHGKAGYLVTRHAGNAYAEAVLRSLQEPHEASVRKDIGYARVNSVYAAAECAGKYASKYLELSRQKQIAAAAEK